MWSTSDSNFVAERTSDWDHDQVSRKDQDGRSLDISDFAPLKFLNDLSAHLIHGGRPFPVHAQC